MLWLLFSSALLSATLLPGGSEALLLYQLRQGGDPWLLVGVAGCGNLLGSVITYAMGLAATHMARGRWISSNDLARGSRWFSRWGRPALLLAWLPVIGDPLTLAAGALRCPLSWFVPLVAIGKFGRYAALVWLAMQA